MTHAQRKTNAGFTLMEVVVALALSIIVLMAIFSLLRRGQESFVRESAVAEVNQNVRAALDAIGRDLTVAGYKTPPSAAVLWQDGGVYESDRLTIINADPEVPTSEPFKCSTSESGNPCTTLDQLSELNINVSTFDPQPCDPQNAYENGTELLAIESSDCNGDGQTGIYPMELTTRPAYDPYNQTLTISYQAGPSLPELSLPVGFNPTVHPDCAVLGVFRVIQYRVNRVDEDTEVQVLERRDLSETEVWTPVAADIDDLQLQYGARDYPAMMDRPAAPDPGDQSSWINRVRVRVLAGRRTQAGPTQRSVSTSGLSDRRLATTVALRNTTEGQGIGPSDKLDKYGGMITTSSESTRTATGFFRVEKIGDRVVLVTPDGNPYWFNGVALVADNAPGRDDTGRSYGDYIEAKYESKAVWASAVKRRLLAWGFNGLGFYSVPRVQSYNNFGREPVEPFMPHFNGGFRFSHYAMANVGDRLDQPVKNLLWMIPDGGVLADFFDPRFEECAFTGVKITATTGGISTEVNSPWMIAWIPDESDNFRGFGHESTHVHPGWAVLATAPTQSVGRYRSKEFRYRDATVYSKLALRDFLKDRYDQSLYALNVAWGSSYTSWGSNGGYGTGTGLLDEDGRSHGWVGHHRSLEGARKALKRDLDDFAFLLAERYFKTVHDAIRSVDKNHLIAGPVTLGGGAREPILRATRDYVDLLFAASRARPRSESDDGAGWGPEAWDKMASVTGKPLIGAAYFITAEPDSPINKAEYMSLPTQEARGQEYAAHLERLRSFRAADGTAPFVGFHWWALVDNWAETRNYGLVTIRDNAFDGKEAIRASGKDPWGYPTGGEKADYGDFITFARIANFAVLERLRQELQERAQ